MVLSNQPIMNTKIKILYTRRSKHSVFPLQTFRVHLESKGNIVSACSHVWRALSMVESTALDYSVPYRRISLQISARTLHREGAE